MKAQTKLFLRTMAGLLASFLPLSFAQAQGPISSNMTLLSTWVDPSIPLSSSGTRYNDLWGYAAGGREYAMLGATNGLYIIDVTIPTAPALVTFQAGGSPNSVWRDYDVYGHHLYAVSDQGVGSSLQIFDLSNLPVSVSKVYDSQVHFSRAHTIHMDAGSGRLYVSGCDAQANGILIFDVASNPANPPLLANFILGAYTHDVFVLRDTCFAFFGGSNAVCSFDFKDLMNPSALGALYTYSELGYAHSGFATPGLDYLYFATETHNTGIHVADISDPYTITHMNTFRSSLLAPVHVNSVGHNPFVRDSVLYVSYYQDGVQLWDISNPVSPTKIGYYDTYPSNTDYTGTRGAWGIYPMLPSGNILVSDTDNGLFVLRHNTSFPVTLTNFSAHKRQYDVLLSWRTESEQNNQGFGVERSADGVHFEEIAFVEGEGSTMTPTDYSKTDSEPLIGRSFYRLRQVDLDGATTYSEIRVVNAGSALEVMSVYPAPALVGETVQVMVQAEEAGDVTLSVTNLLGQSLWSTQQSLSSGLHHLEIPTKGLAAGGYIVKVASKGNVSTHRFVLSDAR